MKDFLEKLAELKVHEPPPDFDRRLHERLNRSLVLQHLVDFFLGALVYSAAHFLRAASGWLLFTIAGRFPDRPRK